MSRTRRTVANAITQIASIFVQSVLVLFVTREIIANVGSDYNGITSTATQLLTFLTLIEGGFTLASLVKLYKPYGEGDIDSLNKYLSLSNAKYKKIGVLYLFVGTVISLAYAPMVKTDAPFYVTAIILVLPVISSAFTVYYVNKYRLLFQVSQSEYIIYAIQIVTNTLMYISEIVMVRGTHNIIYARLCVAFFQVLNGIIVGYVARKKYKHIKYHVAYDDVEITGTSDVFVSRICGLVFSSSSVLFISTFIGTAYTSVYGVYDSVIAVISNVINSMLVAPRNALGQLLSEKEKNKVLSVFNEYEFISSFSVSILYSVTFALLIPFVKLYTGDIADMNYADASLAVLLVLNAIFQMIHIPSGTCIEVSGHFKVVKKIQGVAAVLIIVFSVGGAYFGGLYGILTAKLIISLFLAVAEISYTRRKLLKSNVLTFFKVNIPSYVVAVVLAVVEYSYLLEEELSFGMFLVYGMCLVGINSIVILIINFVINKEYLQASIARVAGLLKKR